MRSASWAAAACSAWGDRTVPGGAVCTANPPVSALSIGPSPGKAARKNAARLRASSRARRSGRSAAKTVCEGVQKRRSSLTAVIHQNRRLALTGTFSGPGSYHRLEQRPKSGQRTGALLRPLARDQQLHFGRKDAYNIGYIGVKCKHPDQRSTRGQSSRKTKSQTIRSFWGAPLCISQQE